MNPAARQKLKGVANWSGKGAQGLAEDVRYYGKWMRDEAEKRIGQYYPQVDVTETAVRQQPQLAPLIGQKLTVIAWLWARTVESPNPAAKSAHVPLVSSFMLSTKDNKKIWVEPVIDANAHHGYRFDVRSGKLGERHEEKAKLGTKAGKAQDFICLLTETPIARTYIQSEGKADRLGTRLMAVVAQGPNGRVYLPASLEQETIAAFASDLPIVVEARETFLSGTTPTRAMITGGVCSAYGLRTWGHLFTARQILALITFSDLISQVHEKILADANAAGLASQPRLAEGGAGADAYADAVATYLGLAVNRLSDLSSNLASWISDLQAIRNTFARQALPMVWDFVECNPVTDKWDGAVEWIGRVLNELLAIAPGKIELSDASGASFGECPLVISSDPPYYDNIGYADLSDFFYVWTRRTLRAIWPNLMETVLVPKAQELVATTYRHGSKLAAENFFMDGMSRAISNMVAAQQHDIPLTIYYAFKQAEIAKEGIVSTGWATFLQAIVQSGLLIDGTLPIRTERSVRMIASGTNALASSIILVCRKRPATAPVTTRAEFLLALKRELPNALGLLQAGNIAPVDLAQASIGPGMGIFTRHSSVLELDDSPMSIKTALQLVNAALDDYLSEQEADYDAETRFAITWFETHGMDQATYGDAETLAKARNVSVSGIAEAGVIESKGGKVRLVKRSEMPADWDPRADARLTVWECTQHMIRRLEVDGESAAADLLARLNGRAEPARDLAYRLYQVCERKKWSEEARAYNGLVVAWPELGKLAAKASASGTPQMSAQGTLI